MARSPTPPETLSFHLELFPDEHPVVPTLVPICVSLTRPQVLRDLQDCCGMETRHDSNNIWSTPAPSWCMEPFLSMCPCLCHGCSDTTLCSFSGPPSHVGVDDANKSTPTTQLLHVLLLTRYHVLTSFGWGYWFFRDSIWNKSVGFQWARSAVGLSILSSRLCHSCQCDGCPRPQKAKQPKVCAKDTLGSMSPNTTGGTCGHLQGHHWNDGKW